MDNLIVTAVAQTSPQNDPAAKKVLDAVSAKFKTFNSPQAGFSYKVENAKGKVCQLKKERYG